VTAQGDWLVSCRRCGALYSSGKCPGCIFHAERAIAFLHSFINQCRAAGIEIRANADRMTDLTDLCIEWTATHGTHHVRRPI